MENFGFFSVRSLSKTATGDLSVGGVASGFYRDLDGEAIHPDAVREAIPDFLAGRGADGQSSAPIRLHHDFWTGFLKQAIAVLRLSEDEQMSLIGAIALPLGRVTELWVDDDGTAHWRGVLSMANPISKILWQILKEGMLRLGVSLGGKIYATEPGRDAAGKPCTVITKIRIDELSVTDSPAYRLTMGEGGGNGASIMALAKSVRKVMKNSDRAKAERFLQKAIEADSLPQTSYLSGDWGNTKVGLSGDLVQHPKPKKGTGKIRVDGGEVKTGMGDRAKAQPKQQGGGRQIPTDVFGLTVKELTRELYKCTYMDKAEMGSPDTWRFLSDAIAGLAGASDAPPPSLINFAKFLQNVLQFAQALPHMSSYQADGTIAAMTSDLYKALDDFREKMGSDLEKKPVRPPGFPGMKGAQIAFPQQYLTYPKN